MIYFATNGDAIKIGRSGNVHARLKSLSTGSEKPLCLIASVDGEAAQEAKAHADLAAYRLNGEWFEDCHAVRDSIREYQARGISVPPADFQIDDEPCIVRECRAAGIKLLEVCERSGSSRMEAYEYIAAKVGTNAEWLRKFRSGHRSAKEPRLSVGYALLSDAALESAGLLVVGTTQEDQRSNEIAPADKSAAGELK